MAQLLLRFNGKIAGKKKPARGGLVLGRELPALTGQKLPACSPIDQDGEIAGYARNFLLSMLDAQG
jgi:hypothetical protein